MERKKYACPFFVALGLLLSSCGTYVPEFQENPWSHNVEKLVQSIAYSIHCELRNSVISIKNEDLTLKPWNHRLIADWLDTWGAQVTLTLSAEELSSFSPSVSYFPAKVFTILGGLTASSDATRIGELDYYFTVKELQSKGPCTTEDMLANANSDYPAGSPLIYSDLKLAEWLSSIVFAKLTGDLSGADPTNKTAKNAIAHHVTFKIVTNGNVTPSWKLVNATINPLVPWFMASRTRTNDLLITFGPNVEAKNPVTGETINSIGTNTPAANSNLAALIGIAIRNQTLTGVP